MEEQFIHPVPKHLDQPLRIKGFTWPQWLLLALACAIAWGFIELLPDSVPPLWRFGPMVPPVALLVGVVYAAGTVGKRSLLEMPMRAVRYALAPRYYMAGRPPSRGPIAVLLYIGKPPEGDPPDA
jgi:hypothetical protein